MDGTETPLRMRASLVGAPLVAQSAGAFDGIPMAALVVSASVLVGCMVMMTRVIPDLPRLAPRRSRIRRTATLRRRAVTGARPDLTHAPVSIQHVPIRRPARQIGPAPDVPERHTAPNPMRIRTPEENLIEHLLARDPDLLAGIIKNWVDADHDDDGAAT